jgi:hypothetical protein
LVRRLTRIFLDAVAVLSLLLAIAVVFLGVRECGGVYRVSHVGSAKDEGVIDAAYAAADGWWGTACLRGFECRGSRLSIYESFMTVWTRPPDLGGWRVDRDADVRVHPRLTSGHEWGDFQIASWAFPDGSVVPELHGTILAMPCWAWLGAFALPPALRGGALVRRRRRARRGREGLCVACG